MAGFGRPETGVNIREVRKFKHPRVRFRYVRGRIIPIINRDAVGRDLTSVGKKAIGVGTSLAIAGIALKSKAKNPGRIIRGIRKFRETAGYWKIKNKAHKLMGMKLPKDTATIKTVKRGYNFFVGHPIRRPVQAGLFAVAYGGLSYGMGAWLRTRSNVGYEIAHKKSK